MNKVFLLLIYSLLIFSCKKKKEKVLKLTSIEIDAQNTFVSLTSLKQAEHLTSFESDTSLLVASKSMFERYLSDRGVPVLSSGADYQLRIEAIELEEDQWSESYKDCDGFLEVFDLESVEMRVKVILYDKKGVKLDDWEKIVSKSEKAKRREVTSDEIGNETCHDPSIDTFGDFNEYKKLDDEIKSLSKKVSNKIYKAEK